jgi:hypothetical protein
MDLQIRPNREIHLVEKTFSPIVLNSVISDFSGNPVTEKIPEEGFGYIWMASVSSCKLITPVESWL